MKRALAVLALAALLLPTAGATPEPTYPDKVEALLPGWIAEAEALAVNDTERPWYADAKVFLDSAKAAQAQGRVRSALFDVETFTELVLSGQLADEASALPSEAERKSLVLQRTAAWHAEAGGAWERYREQLHTLEAEAHSLLALEVALYSADQALAARLMMDEREAVAAEFPKQPTLSPGYVMALVRSSHTALQDIEWATDLLAVAGTYEGLPPRYDPVAWANVTTLALTQVEGDFPQHIAPYEKLAGPIRENNESTLATAIALAEQRASRATSIFVIYGDAQSRGLNVTRDASRAMTKQLDNTTMGGPSEFGLLGIQTADAIDRAIKVRDYAAEGRTDLNVVIGAWSSLDHAQYATTVLSGSSPIQPEDEKPAKTPLAPALAIVAIALAALAFRRRG